MNLKYFLSFLLLSWVQTFWTTKMRRAVLYCSAVVLLSRRPSSFTVGTRTLVEPGLGGGQRSEGASPQGGAAVSAAGAGGALGAVLAEVPGECPPGPGAGGRAAGPAAMPAREPGAQCP